MLKFVNLSVVRITIPLAPPARGVMHKLDNSSSIPVNETLAGHLVFEDPIVPAMSIIRTSKSTGNRQVWPFGELYEPSLVSIKSAYSKIKPYFRNYLTKFYLISISTND